MSKDYSTREQKVSLDLTVDLHIIKDLSGIKYHNNAKVVMGHSILLIFESNSDVEVQCSFNNNAPVALIIVTVYDAHSFKLLTQSLQLTLDECVIITM